MADTDNTVTATDPTPAPKAAPAPEPASTLPAGTVAELPDDAFIPHITHMPVDNVSATLAPIFDDQFVGKGGTYVIDPETGERKRRYEAVVDPKNPSKVVGYRPVP